MASEDGDDQATGVFLVYDRYRFDIVELPLAFAEKRRRDRSNSRGLSLTRDRSLVRSLTRRDTEPARDKGKAERAKLSGLQQLLNLRKSGRIIHLTYSESQQAMCMILDDKSLAKYDFPSETLSTGHEIPRPLLLSVQFPQLKSKMANKLDKGSQMHEQLN